MDQKRSESIEKCYSNEDGFLLFGNPEETISPEMEKLSRRILSLLPKLPSIESDWVHLFFFERWSQDTIAALFGVSQPTVCYRLRRAEQRLRFLLSIPEGVSSKEVCEDISPVITKPLDLAIIQSMWESTCQSETGEKLGVTQGLVRYRFHKALRTISWWLDHPEIAPYPGGKDRIWSYLSVMVQIAQNPNLLKTGISSDEFRLVI